MSYVNSSSLSHSISNFLMCFKFSFSLAAVFTTNTKKNPFHYDWVFSFSLSVLAQRFTLFKIASILFDIFLLILFIFFFFLGSGSIDTKYRRRKSETQTHTHAKYTTLSKFYCGHSILFWIGELEYQISYFGPFRFGMDIAVANTISHLTISIKLNRWVYCIMCIFVIYFGVRCEKSVSLVVCYLFSVGHTNARSEFWSNWFLFSKERCHRCHN